ncbi:Patatin-like phospholipase domain-containing protein 2 [Folsomia candida]|uniref:Patatin-like phospholipase domain-containing protein 2 n=1 Tax=Folsomia candida TaxID=158441 RepID=A0A226DKS7_FOLCA|nr:Patatin-like phospholipase domain-containing protein 2 [Folsomia candida]
MSNKTKFNLSFAGCGFLGIYHVGVAACLKKYAPQLVVHKASGASAGAIAACCLLCDAPLGQITKDVLRIATLARAKTLGPFSPSFNIQKILKDGLEKILPEDAHIRVSGKLHISLTRVYDRQNVIVSHFNSREELIQAVLCSAFIPFFSGFLPPMLKGFRHMDGGFTDNLPALDQHTITVSPFSGENDICPVDDSAHLFHRREMIENFDDFCDKSSSPASSNSPTRPYENDDETECHVILSSAFIPLFSGWMPPKVGGARFMDGCYSDNLPILDENTITVSPFCGESDICPRDPTANLMQVNLANTSIELSRQNLYRFSRTLFPPRPEVLSKMCQQGFDDTLRFLARNDLIGCDTCMTMEQSLSLGVELDEMATKNYERIMSEESCHQCKVQKQAALLDSLPDTVVSILQDAIESGNKGLLNWLFSHKTMKLISLMSLPCIIPADIAYATVLKLFETAPKLTYNLRVLSQAVLQLVAQTLSNISLSPAAYSAKLTCQVAITEYNEDIEAPCDEMTSSPSSLQRKQSIRNKMNFGFTLNIDNGRSDNMQFIDDKRSSIVEFGDEDDDTFERFLSVTSHQDTLISSYYLNNADNQVEITEVFEINETTVPLCDLDPSSSHHDGSSTVEIEEIFDDNDPNFVQLTNSQLPLSHNVMPIVAEI